MIKVISDEKRPIKIWASDLEPEAEAQVRRLANLPFIHSHIALMPDAHAGKGSTVGTVIATKGAIIPSAIGVDIGCGMAAIKLPFKADRFGDDSGKKRLRFSLERSIPTGRFAHKSLSKNVQNSFANLGSFTEISKLYKSRPIF